MRIPPPKQTLHHLPSPSQLHAPPSLGHSPVPVLWPRAWADERSMQGLGFRRSHLPKDRLLQLIGVVICNVYIQLVVDSGGILFTYSAAANVTKIVPTNLFTPLGIYTTTFFFC